MPKSVQLTFRVSPAERDRLRAAAGKEGFGKDRFAICLRRAVFRAAGLSLETAIRPEGAAGR